MLKRSKIVLLVCCLSLSTALYAKNQATLVFNQPANASEAATLKKLQQAGDAREVISLVNQKFKLPKPLSIIFGGDDGPLYDPEINTILTPYTFIDEVKQRFVRAKYSETGVTPDQATNDALMHTLFHELGHALIEMYQLPVVGKEEDAVDSLASVLLIEFYEGGQETVLSAADLFDLESEDRGGLEEADYWDEHSLDEQRFYTTLCHVYGSDPDKYASVIEDTDISEDRADLCIEEYEAASRNWFKLLKLAQYR